ncbi:MAG: hypothetical protein K0V04_16030 [Deltaproteobacteria bacterium]|nr:hypothetical protein [Deltaproteobacteria bacterium]
MLDDNGGISPFGWSVAWAGHEANRLGEDVQALVEWSAGTCKRYFPPERGYQIAIEVPAGAAQGARMSVRRGDFTARVAIERTASGRSVAAMVRRSTPSIRVYGSARSDTLHHAHQLGERLVQRGRVVGWGVGIGLFATLAWLMIGVRDPIYVLGGMLLVVALLLTLMAGGTLGAWVGERLAEFQRGRARRDVGSNPALPDDIRRWKGLSRQLNAQRSALNGRRALPFRREPGQLAS